MKLSPDPRFVATQLTDHAWVVHDDAYEHSDPRRVVARIWQADPDEYEVTWVRALPLDRWYHSVQAVLDDIHAFTPNSTKPIPIPHRSPVAVRLASLQDRADTSARSVADRRAGRARDPRTGVVADQLPPARRPRERVLR